MPPLARMSNCSRSGTIASPAPSAPKPCSTASITSLIVSTLRKSESVRISICCELDRMERDVLLSFDVFHANQFVVFFVVNEFVDDLRGKHDSEPAGTQPEFLTTFHMLCRLVRWICKRRVLDFLDVETL